MQVLNTLYVTTPESYLHLENDTVRIEVEHETRLRVPLPPRGHGGVFRQRDAVPTPLMHRLADSGIGLVLLDGHGRFKARLEGPVSGNVLLRQARYERGRDHPPSLLALPAAAWPPWGSGTILFDLCNKEHV